MSPLSLLLVPVLLSPVAPLGSTQVRGVPPIDEARGDGIYGRFSGDFAWSGELGAEYDGHRESLLPGASAAIRFYQAVGVSAGFWQSVDATNALERRLTLHVLVEPFFILRFRDFGESGEAYADMLLDSIGVRVGPSFLQPRGGRLADAMALSAGIGAGLPLLGRADGPWLRGHVDCELGAGPPNVLVGFTLGWQGFFTSELVEN